MAKEIEHKYKVINSTYRDLASRKVEITQGYLDRNPAHTVRIRRMNDRCFITIKGVTKGDTRAEYEYEIPSEDFVGLLQMCEGRILMKTRYYVEHNGYTWEVDEFHGDNAPCTIAEIELTHSHHEYPLPSFVGEEVTGNPAYYNSNL